MDRIWAFMVIAIILLAGFYQIFKIKKQGQKELKLVQEFQSKFVSLVDSFSSRSVGNIWTETSGMDSQLHTWLTMKADRVQGIIGHFGLVVFTDPIRGQRINNYPVVLNTLSKINGQNIQINELHMVDNSLIRFIGYLDNELIELDKDILNPLKWLQFGVKQVFDVPIKIIKSLGVLSSRLTNRIQDSYLYKSIRGLIALLTIASSIVTIAIGWEEFMKKLDVILKGF